MVYYICPDNAKNIPDTVRVPGNHLVTIMKEVRTKFFNLGEDFSLANAPGFRPLTLAYEVCGELSPGKDNAILLFHALSGSQHAAGTNPAVPGVGALWREECRTGWWHSFIGPNKPLDTRRYCVVCANYLGGCYGSTGPRARNPRTGRSYGGSFPWVTANDIVDSQVRLLDHLGIEQLHAVIGPSLGGMLALNLAVRYPERVRTVIPIAAGMEVSLLQWIHNFEQICAIEEDPDFQGGNYPGRRRPDRGLALARMISHKTFVSLRSLSLRARKEVLQKTEPKKNRYRLSHPVESYLLHQARKFVRRFDANSYLRILSLWQTFDLVRDAGARSAATVFNRCRKQRYLVFSIDSDVCFYPEDQEYLVRRLQGSRIPCRHITVHSPKGHDAFLLEPGLFAPYLTYTLEEKW